MPTIKPKSTAAKRTPTKIVRESEAFIPEGYELPKGDGYFLELKDGENRLRILTAPVFGWQACIDGEWQFVEGRENPFTSDTIDISEKYGTPQLAHFWAVIVWNADEQKVQLWKITQRGVLSGLYSMYSQKEWGDPRNYGIVVTKTVSKKKNRIQG